MFKRKLLKIFSDQKLRKVVRNVSSDITCYTSRIIFIAVYTYVILISVPEFSVILDFRVICGIKLLEKFFSRN